MAKYETTKRSQRRSAVISNRSRELARHLSLSMAVLTAAAGLAMQPALADDKPTKITMVAGDKDDPFYITMMCGAKEEASKLGATLEFQAPQNFSPTDQIPIVNAVAAARPDVLLIAPTDDTAMFVPIKEVADAGTKVVLVDTTLKDVSATVAQVSTNDHEGGVEAAKVLAQLTGGKGKVLLLNFLPGVSTTEARGKGFLETAKTLGLDALGEQFAGTDIQKGTSIVQAALQQTPDLAGIFTTTDFGAQGAVAALRAANKLGEVKVVGFDASPVMVGELQAGDIQAIVSQRARQIGVLGVEQGINALKGAPTSKEPIKVDTLTLTKATLDAPESKAVLQETSCNN
jgi:ribose transport system substrate-binding protein